MIELTQEMGWLTAPARHAKLLPGWKCEDTAGSCHKPQSSEEPSSPVGRVFNDNKNQSEQTFPLDELLVTNTHTGCEYNTDLLKEHSFSAGAVFADFRHAVVFPHYFGFLLQGCQDMTK